MANNKINSTEKILVKVDHNNLIYIDPNSVVSDGIVQTRNVEPENLVMYVNLEADLIPRSVLISNADNSNTLVSIARGTMNFLQPKTKSHDLDTAWTDAFLETDPANKNGNGDIFHGDQTAQSFGIESVSIRVTGANFIPSVVIKFIDVRGKTLFESPENSPYNAFFHIPWPIFYLTVKGYYGKAIKYRLHLVTFSSKFNSTSGNFEIDTTYVGSTYAYLNDIPLEGILNAPYMYPSVISNDSITYNPNTGNHVAVLNKSTKGYRILSSVYQEYITKGLLPKNFPVKTLREIVIIAGRLNKILEAKIFSKVIDFKVLNAIKDYEYTITTLWNGVNTWKSKYLAPNYTIIPPLPTDPTKFPVQWYPLAGGINGNNLNMVTGDTASTLEHLLRVSIDQLDDNLAFGAKARTVADNKVLFVDKNINGDTIKTISLNNLLPINKYYTSYNGTYYVSIEQLLDDITDAEKNFVEQRNKLELTIEEKMNEIVKSDKTIGLGFEPTIRNIMGIVLANADTYVRLMKEVHQKAFNVGNQRKKILSSVLTDSPNKNECIYPWPEVKKQAAGGKQQVLEYPGSREMAHKLNTKDPNLWPEIDFIEEFYQVSTKKSDPLNDKEGDVDDVDYIYDSNSDLRNKKDISSFTALSNTYPYFDKSISSILYEIFERAKYNTSFSPFNNESIKELVNIEFTNLSNQISEDDDIKGILLKTADSYDHLLTNMAGFSPFERYPYYLDQLPTVPYISDLLKQDFKIEKFTPVSPPLNNGAMYPVTNAFLDKYNPEEYRSNIYPFNSSLYKSYVDNIKSDTYLNKILTVNTSDGDFIVSPINPNMWVKDGNSEYINNLFINTIKINGSSKQILNTPYFHKQLYNDFTKIGVQEKYTGSAYLLLNSLPLVELYDTITYNNKKTLVSRMFREIGATHYIPYHLMLKWGSIYHRYKKYILEGIDIIKDVTVPIDINQFFDNFSGRTYDTNNSEVTISDKADVGLYPFYHSIFHQIVNDYTFYDQTATGTTGTDNYYNSVTGGTTNLFSIDAHSGVYEWTGFIDDTKLVSGDDRYTLLPSNGNLRTDDTNPTLNEQENFRIVWEVGDDSVIDYSLSKFPSYNEYTRDVSNNTYELSENYKKVIDLMATFKPDILDVFEQAFLDFSRERVNEEMPYKEYNVKYTNFQELLKDISTVIKVDGDEGTVIDTLVETIKTRQLTSLLAITRNILSNDNLIRLTLANPREFDGYVLGGFVNLDVRTFSVNPYNDIFAVNNLYMIDLYLGEDLDGYYLDFFREMNIEVTEENIKQFRAIIYVYAGLRSSGLTTITKSYLSDYLTTNIITGSSKSSGVQGTDKRLSFFLDTFTKNISTTLKVGQIKETLRSDRGFNDDILKLEMYNHFKSFNDKWVGGNSIGQRTLMEEFLFLDRANKDIGSSVYLDMERLLSITNTKNKKISLYSLINLLIQDTGFDIRALPSYINFYGTNFSNKAKITPSKNVAQNIFGTFLEVNYQDSMPKIILQYIGKTSKHLELSDISKQYKYKNDGFNIGSVHNNTIIVAPDVFTQTDYSKSNKVVAFEVSFGDQNQSIFKGVQLDQTSIKNTSESFRVLERLGQTETGSSTAQIDIGLLDIYRQASYQCEVTAMGNVMIQPTMYFYIKNIPMFRGSYWISEVTHNIKTTGIETSFKGSRIPTDSLPDPKDSFLASYRPFFDRMVKDAKKRVNDKSKKDTTETWIETDNGPALIDKGTITINGETVTNTSGTEEYGIPFNGDPMKHQEKYIQKVSFKQGNTSEEWLRSIVLEMGVGDYQIDDSLNMSLLLRLPELVTVGKKVTWGSIKDKSNDLRFYSSHFFVADTQEAMIDKKYTVTQFLNPLTPNKRVTVNTNYDFTNMNFEGPINSGPAVSGYGIGISGKLRRELGVKPGDVIYFKMLKGN